MHVDTSKRSDLVLGAAKNRQWQVVQNLHKTRADFEAIGEDSYTTPAWEVVQDLPAEKWKLRQGSASQRANLEAKDGKSETASRRWVKETAQSQVVENIASRSMSSKATDGRNPGNAEAKDQYSSKPKFYKELHGGRWLRAEDS
eukprot:gnl/MRDRNA2_/MRDRNA2_369954_c0_seq1.p3 gnl/MRDRNA2_/MRDRNA2_369954_c0~~gnl/MRDRNA2_/MRDRNA2_369954_c0_seq1.p3  ORF type:complete len:144 (-),score=32.93 gnl/MRDRNA2_/MRDRNA2_369954_c0_seq1:550-981(-)